MVPARILPLITALLALAPGRSACAEPPRVVKASPDNGDLEVDPATRLLRVTFDQSMQPGGMSVVGGGDAFPEVTGRPRWRSGNREFVFPIKLKPDHDYRLSINNARFTNFRNRAGEPAVPYPIVFRTGPATPADSPHKQESAAAAAAIDAARDAVQDHYSYRDRLGIDWEGRFDAARGALLRAQSPQDFAKKLGLVLAKFEDKHIWLAVGEERFSSFVRPVVPNANFRLLPQLVPGWTMHGRRLATGAWDDGVKYLAIGNWSRDDVADHLPPALQAVADAKLLIIDVRGNGGGDERLARQVAGCMTDTRLLYGKHVTRDPGAEDGFTPVQERWLPPASDGPRIEARVVVLTGPVVMSSCESFLLMMKATGATLVGGQSQGSSGNPKPHDLGNGVVLYLPSWKDMASDGVELEGVGIAPDIAVDTSPQAFESRDPVLERALDLLRTPTE